MRFFTMTGVAESCSAFALFFVAMPLKYIGGNEILVKIIGPIHGILWSIYIALLWWGIVEREWNFRAFIVGGFLSIFPGGPIWLERRLDDEKYRPAEISD